MKKTLNDVFIEIAKGFVNSDCSYVMNDLYGPNKEKIGEFGAVVWGTNLDNLRVDAFCIDIPKDSPFMKEWNIFVVTTLYNMLLNKENIGYIYANSWEEVSRIMSSAA